MIGKKTVIQYTVFEFLEECYLKASKNMSIPLVYNVSKYTLCIIFSIRNYLFALGNLINQLPLFDLE